MALISVIVPVYDNAESLRLLMDRLAATAGTLTEDTFEFVFVDDGSADESFEAIQCLQRKDDRVRAVRLSRNFGSNAAVLAGLTFARGDCAVIIAADLQDPPELIPQLVMHWRAGNQVVLAARGRRNDPIVSRLLATAFNRLFRLLVFPGFPKDGFDFALIDRPVVDVLVEMREKNSHIFGQLMWVGFRRQVVHYDRSRRSNGRSGWTTAKKIKYFIDAFTAFSCLPLRAASIIGMTLAALGLIYALVIIGYRMTTDVRVAGWASLTVIVLVTAGSQLLLVGVLGEYLWRVLDESRHRPPFIVSTVVNCHLDPDEVPRGCRHLHGNRSAPS